MTEEKKQSEEKKYAQIWREFVRHCGDAVGCHPLSTDIAALLSEDATYRLREAIQNAGQFMRHAKRKKLTNTDFNNALRWSDVEPVYGYSSPDPLPFINVKEAEVFCPEDHEINLVLMATGTHAYEHPGVSALKAQWLAIEGVQKPDTIATATASATAKKNGTAVVVPAVSDNLMAYYNHVTKAILGNNEEVTKIALNDLKTNPKISTLLPFFINFVCVGVKKVSHDLAQLTKLLHTVRSLTDNRYLCFGPRPLLKLLIQGVLYCIVEPLAASLNPINDHWALRDYAARLLANIVRLWNTPVNQLYQNTLDALQDIFRDLTKPFCSHYGAIMAMMALGIEPVRTCVYPNIARYWTHLMTTLEDSSLSSVPFKSDANKVYGALQLASEFLMLHEHRELSVRRSYDNKPKTKDETNIPLKTESCKLTSVKSEVASTSRQLGSKANTKSCIFEVETAYDKLYEYFGDALAARLPYVHVEDFYVPKPPKLINLFTTPELTQTGEELLESFNVKEEEVQSNSMEDDRYSYDDNSPMSDEVEVESVDVDLRIKSTVSDPTLGIKLTIAKLPRALPPPPPVESAKVKKLSIKISKEQFKQTEPTTTLTQPADEVPRPVTPEGPFEVVVMKRSSMYIEFNFDGSMPIPRDQLKRQRIEKHPFCKITGNTEVNKISLRMKSIRKRRTKSSSVDSYKRFLKMFRSADITAII